MTSTLRPVLAILALAIALLLVNGGGYDLWPPDEPRYAEVAREMVESGDYLVPRINGETYLEKPPLLFWLMSVFGVIFGDVNEWAARLPSMLAGLYVIAMTYLLGARLFDRRVAAWAAIILLTSLGFWLQARKGQIDMLLAACLITTFYALWRWDEERAGKWLCVAYAGMGLGMLAKGPPALVFPLLLLVAFYWKNPEGRKATRWILGALSAIVLTMLWYIPARLAGAETAEQAIESGIGANLFRNTIGRFVLGVSKAQPPWYYLETLPVDFLPWTLICPALLYWAWKNRKASRANWFLFAWMVPAFIFFSISIGKRGLYLVPIYPAIALTLALAWVKVAEEGNLKWIKRGALLWCAVLMLIACTPMALPWVPYALRNPTHVYMLALAAGVLGAGGFILVRRIPLHAPRVLAAQMSVLYLVAAFTVFPEIDHFKSARPVCAPVRQLVDQGVDLDLYSVGFSREEYIYYARHFHTPVLIDLVGEVPPEDLMAQAKLQKEAQDTIKDAVEDIPIENLASITPAEQQLLLDAITEAVGAHERAEEILAFEHALIGEVARFFEVFVGPGPAMAFIQEEEWRWLVPLYPGKIPVSIIVDRPVGSRHVLLVANEAAVEALKGA